MRARSLLPPTARAVLLVLLAALALLTGSSCGGGDRIVASGSIEVVNSYASFEFIDAIRIVEAFGPDIYFFDVFLVPGEGLVVDGLYATTYDVTVYWSDDARDTFMDVDVMPHWTTQVLALN